MSDSKLLEWIEAAENETGETVSHVFIETFNRYNEDPNAAPRRLLTRDQFLTDEWATKEFYSGFGGAECPSFIAWSENWILYVHEYDGATSLAKLPRNPSEPIGDVYYGDVW